MKETVRPAPVAAALRVKDLAVDLASDLAEGYRKSTRFFRLRVAVLGTWAVLAIVTLWLACPSSGGPTNSLGAEVQVQAANLMGTQLYLRNSSGRPWTDVTLTLDGTWRWHVPSVRDQQVVETRRFQRGGEFAPSDLAPRSLTIECAQGSVTLPLSSRPP